MMYKQEGVRHQDMDGEEDGVQEGRGGSGQGDGRVVHDATGGDTGRVTENRGVQSVLQTVQNEDRVGGGLGDGGEDGGVFPDDSICVTAACKPASRPPVQWRLVKKRIWIPDIICLL